MTSSPRSQPGVSRDARPRRPPEHDFEDRTFIERLSRSRGIENSPRPPLIVARNVAAALIVALVSVQVVLWLVLVVVNEAFVFPWFVFEVAGGGLLVAVLSVLSRRAAPRAQDAERCPADGSSRANAEARSPRAAFTWRRAFRAAVLLYVVSTVTQLGVWLLLGMGGEYDSPWWAWSALPLGGVVLVVGALARHEPRDRHV